MKKVFFVLVGLLIVMSGRAVERSEAEAAALAMNFINATESHNKARHAAVPVSVTLSYRCNKVNSTSPAFYIFNRNDQAGSVIVSADDRAEILGYTDSGAFDYETANPNVRWFLSRYQNQLSAAQEEDVDVSTSATTTAIAPLLGAIRWEQEEPYNNLCPEDLLDSAKCPTGCVATAAAQIMYMWRYPEKGTGTHQYEWACYEEKYPYDYKTKVLKMKFDTVRFDWDNMCNKYTPNRYTSVQANAVATLMYACGIACNMSYASDGSGSYTDDMGYGLITYFGYTYTKFITSSSERMYEIAKGWEEMPLKNMEFSCSTDDIATYLNSDLEAGRPVLMGGYDNIYGGHEFVCDGRDSGGLFHINWGWGNAEIGYYALNALGKSYDFSSEIDALIGLEPKNRTTGLWETTTSSVPVRKMMIHNRLLIQRGDHLYDVQGRALY